METKVIIQRFSVTAVILTIFVLGRHILVPGVDVSQIVSVSDNQYLFRFVSGMTGGDLSTVSFFSLGLGPWMSTQILWRVLTLVKKLELQKLTTKQSYHIKILMTLVVAVIQSFVISTTITISDDKMFLLQDHTSAVISITLIMLTGAVFLIWLSNVNEAFGVGGPIVLILAGILIQIPRAIVNYIETSIKNGIEIIDVVQGIVIILAVVFLIRIAVIMQDSELRLPLRHALGSGSAITKSYLPISVNPAGGMPLMYSLTITVLPQYVLQMLKTFYPNNSLITYLIAHISISQPMGVTLYIVVLLSLSVGFAFVNIDPDKISEDFQHVGDYIENIEPGNKTRVYITQKVYRLAIIGAVYLGTIAGIPLYIGTYNSDFTQYGMAIGTVIILVSLALNVYEQIYALDTKHQYPNLINRK